MDRTFVDRVRRALEPSPGSLERRREPGTAEKHVLAITRRMYSIAWDQGFLTNRELLYPADFLGEDAQETCDDAGDYSVYAYYEGVCKMKGEAVARFTASGDTLLSELAERLTGSDTLPEMSFFAVEKEIYLRSLEREHVRFATMQFQLRRFDIRTWDASLETCIGNISKEIYFCDGGILKGIEISKILFLHRRRRSYVLVKHLQGRAQLCKCCLKSNAAISMLDDPILPDRKKYICKQCFNLLFLDERGAERYGVQYEFLYK